MARYYVEMTVSFAGHLEADSAKEAEELAWTSWGDTMDNDLTYSGVEEIDVQLDEEEEEDEDE